MSTAQQAEQKTAPDQHARSANCTCNKGAIHRRGLAGPNACRSAAPRSATANARVTTQNTARRTTRLTASCSTTPQPAWRWSWTPSRPARARHRVRTTSSCPAAAAVSPSPCMPTATRAWPPGARPGRRHRRARGNAAVARHAAVIGHAPSQNELAGFLAGRRLP